MLEQFIAQEYMLCGASAIDKKDAIAKVVGHVSAMLNTEQIVKALMAREAKKSSGWGKELALPHLIGPAVPNMIVVFATFKNPVEWASVDGKPIRIVGMVLSPPRYLKEYFPLMLQVSKTLAEENIRRSLLSMTTASQMVTVLNAAKTRYA